jgi:ANTAR domain
VSYDRLADVWGRLAEHAAAYGRRVCVADACAVATKLAGLSGAWVAAARNGEPDFVMCVTDTVCEQLAELQLTLGEGPCWDVLADDAPVLAADLGEQDTAGRWPAFAPAASGLGAAALFAFPLEVGAARSGVLALYRRSPGSLPAGALGDLLVVADVATILLLDGADQAADGGSGSSDRAGFDGQAPGLAMHRAEIDQATGMLMAQLSLPAAQAFSRLRAYAYAHDRRLADVAGDIVARLVRLDADPAPDPDP